MMAGITLTSTLDVITRDRLSPCLRSKTEIVLVASPKQYGLLKLMIMFLILSQCCLIYLAEDIFLQKNKKVEYIAIMKLDLALLDLMIYLS
jgi:hypothetical protein